MSLSYLLQSIGRPIAYHPGLVPILGSVNAVILFGQIFYWQDKTNNPLGVYKSTDEIEEETGLSYREQTTARAKLVDAGVLIETNKRLEHRIYFKIDTDRLDALLANCEKRISRNDKSAFRETTKAHFDETTKAHFDIHRLPETTAETTAGIAAAPDAESSEAYLKRITRQDNARQQVIMTTDWQPSEQFKALMMRAGIRPDALTDEILAKFQIFHNGESKQQNRWESALVMWCRREQYPSTNRPSNAPKNGHAGSEEGIQEQCTGHAYREFKKEPKKVARSAEEIESLTKKHREMLK